MFALLESLRTALQAMRVNKFRTGLTLLGVLIGVASVLAIGAIGQSGKRLIMEELETFGTTSLWVSRRHDQSPTRTERHGWAITNDDLAEIVARCDRVRRVSPMYGAWGKWARVGSKYARCRIIGVSADYASINNEALRSGRFLVPGDVAERRKVCVIGTEIQKALFGADADPGGAWLDIGMGKFQIVGVLAPKNRDFLASIGSLGGETANDRVVIPYTTFQTRFGLHEIEVVQAQALSVDEAETAARQVCELLALRHGGRFEYKSETMKQYIDTTNKVVGVAWWVALVAAGISLVVGGIGIMNIMTSSVMERVREIGVRKAVGAKDRDILLQFLVEAVVISVSGGVLGLGVGVGATLAIEVLFERPIALSWYFLTLGFGVSVVTGIISGLYPAWRAALMDPVYALRYE
ncbi:MAG: ABC transporter permease [Planctomycetes bacterium]|nr:ABC transporter permease [Planctomycetota bacterium]